MRAPRSTTHDDAERTPAPHRRQRDLGAGTPVPSALRATAEATYGHRLDDVSIHSGPTADAYVRSVGARATAEGNRVALASSVQPGTLTGDAVLAHELAHVVQQGSSATPAGPQTARDGPPAAEHEAHHAAAAVLARSGQHDTAIRSRGFDPAAVAERPAPRLSRGLGLRLQRCSSEPDYATARTGPAPETATPTYAGAKDESFRDVTGMFDYRNGAYRATIDGDGDQSAELELGLNGSKPDDTVFHYPQQLDVTATRVGNTAESGGPPSDPQTKSFDISGQSAERDVRPKLEQRTDGRSPTKITAAGGLYVPFATMWVHPPSPDGAQADYRTVVERRKGYGDEVSRSEQTFSFSRDPSDLFPVFLAGTPQRAGSIWALDVTMGRYGDLYRLTFYKPDASSAKVRMGVSPMSGGSAAGTEAIDVEASGPLNVSVVRSRGPVLELDLNGDQRTDIRLFERMTPSADYMSSNLSLDPHQFRELALTVTDAQGRELGYSRRSVEKGQYNQESVKLADEFDVVSAAATPEGLADAAEVPDLATDLARMQTTLATLRRGAGGGKTNASQAVLDAYDRLINAWLALAAAPVDKREDPRRIAQAAALAFHVVWSPEVKQFDVGDTTVDEIGDYTTYSNPYSGYSSSGPFSETAETTVRLLDALKAGNLKTSGQLMSELGSGMTSYIAFRYREKGLEAEAKKVEGLNSLGPMLERLADKKDLKRVTAVFHSAPEFIQTGSPGNLSLRLYYWQEGSTWYLQDLTHPTREDSVGILETSVSAGETEPPDTLFQKLNDKKRYPKGYIQYVLPGDTGRAGFVHTTEPWTVAEVAGFISLGLAAAALLASVVLTGGAAAVAVPALWAASAGAGAVAAVAEMVHESDQGRLTGGKIVMGVAQLIGSVAGGAVSGLKAVTAARLVLAGKVAGEAAVAASALGAAESAGTAVAKGGGSLQTIGTLRILTMTQVGADTVQIVMSGGDLLKQLAAIADSDMSPGDKLKAYALAIGQFGVMAGLSYAGVRGNLHELNTALSKPGARLIQAGGEVLVPGRTDAAGYASELEKYLKPETAKNLASERVRVVSPEEAGSSIGLSRVEVVNGKAQVVVVDGVHPSAMREEAIHIEQLALAEQSVADLKKLAKGDPAMEAELLHTRKAASDLLDISQRWAKATPLEKLRAHEARLELEVDGQRRLIAQLKADVDAGKQVAGAQVDNAFQHLDNLQTKRAELVGTREYVAKGGKPGEVDPQLELPPSLFAKKLVPSSEIPPAWYGLSQEEFIRAYKAKYPVSSLDDADLALRYTMNKRLNPATGRLVDISQDRVEIPAQYKAAEESLALRGPKASMSSADEAKTTTLLAQRDAARAERDLAKAKVPPDVDAANKALYRMVEASRQIGEHAASVWVAKAYPGPPKPQLKYPPAGAPSRSGDFDQIWQCTGKDGKEVWIVVEAKGGSADLGSRRTSGGTGPRAEQGSREYYLDIIANMQKPGSTGRGPATALEDAARAGKEVRYVHVSTPIESVASPTGQGLTSQVNEVSIREFDLTTGSASVSTTTTVAP